MDYHTLVLFHSRYFASSLIFTFS